MSKIFLSIFLLLAQVLIFPKEVSADVNIQCDGKYKGYIDSVIFPPQANLGQVFDVTVNFNKIADPRVIDIDSIYIKLTKPSPPNIDVRSSSITFDNTTRTATFHFAASGIGSNKGTLGNFNVTLNKRKLFKDDLEFGEADIDICKLGTINFADPTLNDTQCNIKMPPDVQLAQPFSYNIEKNDLPQVKYVLFFFKQSDIDIISLPHGAFSTYSSLSSSSIDYYRNIIPNYKRVLPNVNIDRYVYITEVPPNTNSATPPNLGWAQMTYDNSGGNRLNGGPYTALLEARKDYTDSSAHFFCSVHSFTVGRDPTTPPDQWTNGTPVTQQGQGGTIGGGELTSESCLKRAEHDPNIKCSEAAGKPCDGSGIKTAIGCIHAEPKALVKDFLTFATGISGGLAFLMMILGAFQMLTSAGNPESLQAGRDRFTSAIIGLLLIIFAVLLMQIIGVGILNIPGFGR